MAPTPRVRLTGRWRESRVLVRFFINDDLEQARRARRLVEEAGIYVCTTVWLETEWVLRSTYKLRPPNISQLLKAFAGLPRVRAEDPSRLASALAAMERGVDFADALHLGGAVGCEAFFTFDQALERPAGVFGQSRFGNPHEHPGAVRFSRACVGWRSLAAVLAGRVEQAKHSAGELGVRRSR